MLNKYQICWMNIIYVEWISNLLNGYQICWINIKYVEWISNLLNKYLICWIKIKFTKEKLILTIFLLKLNAGAKFPSGAKFFPIQFFLIFFWEFFEIFFETNWMEKGRNSHRGEILTGAKFSQGRNSRF